MPLDCNWWPCTRERRVGRHESCRFHLAELPVTSSATFGLD